MAFEERPAVELEQNLRPPEGGTQSPSDARRKYDRGNFFAVLRQWPFPDGPETAVRLRRHEASATSTSASTSGGSVLSQDLPSSLRIFESGTCRPPATKFAALRNEIRSPSLSFLLEAHD